MQAIAFTAYGGPSVTKILSLPIPEPKAGEVQVKVSAGGLNPLDARQRAGELKMIMPFSFPIIAGNEFSGIVSKLGDNVTEFQIGDKVMCRVTKSGMGGFGEYTVMPSDIIAKAPKTINLVDSAGIPLAGLTAHQALEKLDVKKGDRILITGGAGGVGLLAIQLAKMRGAYVITTASDAGYDNVKEVGADQVINYRKSKVKNHNEKFEKILDLVGGEETLIQDIIPSCSKGGKIVSIAGPLTPGCLSDLGWKSPLVNGLLWYKARSIKNAAYNQGVEYEFMFMYPDGKQLGYLSQLVDEGKLKVKVDSKYKMQEFASAYERLESGRSKGKVIVEIAGES